jgi:hypothetical protein
MALNRVTTDLVVALIVGPPIGFTITAAVFAVYPLFTGGGIAAVLVVLITGVFYGCTVGIAANLAIGFPAHVVLSRLGARAIWWYGLAGIAGGLVVAAVFATNLSNGPDAIKGTVGLAPFCIFAGVATACAGWLIRRPGRDANPGTPAP